MRDSVVQASRGVWSGTDVGTGQCERSEIKKAGEWGALHTDVVTGYHCTTFTPVKLGSKFRPEIEHPPSDHAHRHVLKADSDSVMRWM